MSTYLDKFVDAYVACALWSSTDDTDAGLDANYGPEDIEPETLASMRKDCHEFIVRAGMEVRRNWTPEQAGHDFWLTRNHHGAGFWDRGQPDGDELTEIAYDSGPRDLLIGDDGRLYA